MPIFDVFLSLLTVFIWGITFVVVKWGVGLVPPLLLCAFRFFFVCFPAVFFIPCPKIPLRHIFGYGFIVSVVQFGLIFSAIYLGLPAGLSSILMQVQVFFTLILAYFLFDQRPTLTQVLCAVIAFLGILLIGIGYFRDATLTVFFMAIGAGCSWGAGNLIAIYANHVYVKQQLDAHPHAEPVSLDMFSFVIWSCLVAPIPLLLLSFWLEGPHYFIELLTYPTWPFVICVLFLSIAHIASFGLWSHLLAKHSVALISPFSLLIPVISLTASYIVLGETIKINEFLGVLLVLGGLGYSLFSDRLKAQRVTAETIPNTSLQQVTLPE